MTNTGTQSKWVRLAPSKGVTTVAAALLVLFLLGVLLAPSSVSSGAVLGMLPFAAVLAIVGLGQMLVVQQGGIDLSVPGSMSLAIVIISHYPSGESSLILPALGIAVLWAVGAGLLNAFLIGGIGLNPIIATLGTNALLFGAILAISGGTPRATAQLLRTVAGDRTFGDTQFCLLRCLGASDCLRNYQENSCGTSVRGSWRK